MSKNLKFSAVFAAVVFASGCTREPVRVDKFEKTDSTRVSGEHRVLLIRNGCEVGYTINNETGTGTAITAICPPPGVEGAKDTIGKGVKYQPLYTRYGCEVGILGEATTLVLCPSTGESQTNHTESSGKGQTRKIIVDQHRPK